MATRPNIITTLEETSGRRIGITFSLNNARGQYHPQLQSPLFSLPQAIRAQIFTLALSPQPLPNIPLCRPGYTAHLHTEPRLLLTCRRIFLEANHLPMNLSSHSFFDGYSPAPKARSREWMRKLTRHNRENFGASTIFAPMYVFEELTDESGAWKRLLLQRKGLEEEQWEFRPREVRVVVRYIDWPNWRTDGPLTLNASWVQSLLDTPDFRSTGTLKLELEVPSHKTSQLVPILAKLRQLRSRLYETHIIGNKPATSHFVLSPFEETYTWPGPTSVDSHVYAPYPPKPGQEYIVTTLTWNLDFPSLPQPQDISHLRLSHRLPPPEPLQPRAHLPRTQSWHRDPRPLTMDSSDDEEESLYQWDRRHKYDESRPSEGERELVKMGIGWQKIQREGVKVAERCEEGRREKFERSMGKFLPGRWEREGSLLRFVG